MAIKVHQGDLPEGLDFGSMVAVDTETMGLNAQRDKLCVVQLSAGDDDAHLVQLDRLTYQAPRLKALASAIVRALRLCRSRESCHAACVSANASDNVGVPRVDLLVNGELVASDPAAPYSFVWTPPTAGC